MNELKIIDQREVLGKKFRVYGDFENPLFLARDVAEWIDFAKTGNGSFDVSRMINTIDDSEKLLRTFFVSGQNREMWFLTEDGLYEVLMQSRKPIAKKFKKKVKEVLKEIRLHGMYANSELSPQLQLLINMELKQKELETRQTKTEQKLDNIREIVALTPTQWRKDTTNLINKMALSVGGYDHIGVIRDESYNLLEQRFGVNLKTRLTNKKKTLKFNGVSNSNIDKVNQLDVIADDKKLIEGYIAIIKEMAIRYGVDVVAS